MTETPCVIVNVMRGGPSTGMPTRPAQADLMQARWGTHGDDPVIVVTTERERRSPRIMALTWARIEVEGVGTFRDAKVFLTGARRLPHAVGAFSHSDCRAADNLNMWHILRGNAS